MSNIAVKKEGENPSIIKKIFSNPVIGPYIALLVIVIVSAVASENFLTPTNISNVLVRASVVGVVSIGMTVVLLVGGIDLSVSYTMSLTACLLAHMLQTQVDAGKTGMAIGSVLLVLILGCLIGLINGAIIVLRNLEPFIVTLGVGEVISGITMLYTNGAPGGKMTDFWTNFGKGDFIGIPFTVWLFIVMMVIFMVVLHKTIFGRHIYAIGSNAEAARLTGIKVKFNKIMAYVICGFTAALAGIMLMARVRIGEPKGATGYDMDAIAAVVIGGTAMSGGKGTLAGTLAGVLIMAIMNNILNLVGVNANLQIVVKGLIILVAVLIQKQDK